MQCYKEVRQPLRKLVRSVDSKVTVDSINSYIIYVD